MYTKNPNVLPDLQFSVYRYKQGWTNTYWLSSRNRTKILLARHSSTRQSVNLCCYNYFAIVYFPSCNV